MEPNNKPTTICHVVAMPYPGRGHINPMMNFCKLLASKKDEILITFVVTEEWLGFLSSEPKPPANIRFATIPNVVPSEKGRAADFPGFFRAVLTKMEEPFERLLERLDQPQKPSVIMHDTYLMWVVDVGNRRNIPVASFWTQQMSVFTVFYHFDLLEQNGQFPINVSERGNELVNYIPGIPPTRIADLPAVFSGKVLDIVHTACEALSRVPKVQYLLLTSIYELESQTIDAIKAAIPTQVYSIGPSIPYFGLGDNSSMSTDSKNCETSYVQWLDSQPKSSVLYISLGSFLFVSRTQMDEIIAGVDRSCVRGHINPMMSLCQLLASKTDRIRITFVVTEEWLGFLGSESKPPANVRFATVPNVLPSEIGRAADFPGFYEAAQTKLEEPFEWLLDRLEPPEPGVIIYDTEMPWVVGVGNRRDIPVASLWTMPASVFTVFHHFDLLVQNGHFPADVSG
ncbi:hypothetical protein C3L33_04466, partial [Rhododendron williamsianum]